MESIDRDHYRLSTGREFYANNGIIGLERVDEGLRVTEGYDGGVRADEFTATERAELAAYMVRQWTEFGCA